MSSSLEIVFVHLPDNVAPDHEQSNDIIKAMKYVRAQSGNKSVRWGRAVGRNVTVCFFEWERLDDYHKWQKEPSYKEFRNFWMNFAHAPSTGIPPLEIRHLPIDTTNLERVLSKKFLEIATAGEHHDHSEQCEHQGKPHFTSKVVEGFGEGQLVTLTGLDNDHEGLNVSQKGHEAAIKVALGQTA